MFILKKMTFGKRQVAMFVDDRFFCAGFFDILLGSHNVRLNATEEPSRFEVRANVSIVHPEWSSFRFMNDIALIKLPQPVKFTRIII